MKEKAKKIDLTRLNEIIKNLKISQVAICEEIEMPQGTFRKKLIPNFPEYHFTEEEYSAVISAIGKLGVAYLNFFKKETKKIHRNSIVPK